MTRRVALVSNGRVRVVVVDGVDIDAPVHEVASMIVNGVTDDMAVRFALALDDLQATAVHYSATPPVAPKHRQARKKQQGALPPAADTIVDGLILGPEVFEVVRGAKMGRAARLLLAAIDRHPEGVMGAQLWREVGLVRRKYSASLTSLKERGFARTTGEKASTVWFPNPETPAGALLTDQ